MVFVPFSQKHSVAVVASLTKNLDGDLDVKMDLGFTALLKYSQLSVTYPFRSVCAVMETTKQHKCDRLLIIITLMNSSSLELSFSLV